MDKGEHENMLETTKFSCMSQQIYIHIYCI